jgi:hypothetical protein
MDVHRSASGVYSAVSTCGRCAGGRFFIIRLNFNLYCKNAIATFINNGLILFGILVGLQLWDYFEK